MKKDVIIKLLSGIYQATYNNPNANATPMEGYVFSARVVLNSQAVVEEVVFIKHDFSKYERLCDSFDPVYARTCVKYAKLDKLNEPIPEIPREKSYIINGTNSNECFRNGFPDLVLKFELLK